MSISVVVFAINPPGRYVLECVIERGFDVKMLVTRRGTYNLENLPDVTAKEHGIPVVYIDKFAPKLVSEIAAVKPDLIICGWFHRLIPKEILDSARLAAVNLHPSLLPKYRGPRPIEACLAAGESRTGLTVHKLTEAFDSGDILWQVDFPIFHGDTSEMVLSRILSAVPEAIRHIMLRAEYRYFDGVPQRTMEQPDPAAPKMDDTRN